jgi:uncharacterized membrane protein YcaP (DUF421 family)
MDLTFVETGLKRFAHKDADCVPERFPFLTHRDLRPEICVRARRMDYQLLLGTAGRSVVVYFLMLLVIRVLGKRTVGNLSAFDLLVALMLGEVVDEMIYGDVTFGQGLAAIIPLAAVEYLNSWLSYLNHGVEAVLEGRPTIVVKDGEFQRKGMRAERMNDVDIMAALRRHGIEDLREVKLATVEADGDVSVIERPWARPTPRADVLKDAGEERDRDLRGQPEPAAAQSSISREALNQ